MGELSERTKAEREAGRLAVVRAQREVWARAIQRKYLALAPRHAVSVWLTEGGHNLRCEVYELRAPTTVVFSREEPWEAFPVEEIATQIMLVAG